MKCESCKKEHDGSYGSGRFCSRACSNRRIISEKQKKKVSAKLIKLSDRFCKCGKKLGRYSGSIVCRSCLFKNRAIESKYGLSTFDRIDYNNERKRIIRSQYIKKAGGKCIYCGYSRYEGALDFHHRDPKEKAFALSVQNFGTRKDLLDKEIEKCDLLCSNCHRELHHAILAHSEEQVLTKHQVVGS